LEKLTIGLAVREDFDPFDVVVLFHGVGDAADLDLDPAVGFFDDRDVLFHALVGRLGGQVFHGLATADQIARAAVQHLDYVPAYPTLVDL